MLLLAAAAIASGSWVQDKNFYVLTLLEEIPAVRAELSADPQLAALLKAKDAPAIANAGFTDSEIESVRSFLERDLPRSPALRQLVKDQLRPSHRYIASEGLADAALLGEAWTEAAQGVNGVIRRFTTGKCDTGIDSPSYDPNSPGYQARMTAAENAACAAARANPHALFFEPSLNFALRLMAINRRDEPARHEPLASGENRLAMEAAKHADWSKYKYACLLVHGIGPDDPGMAITPESRENCALGAKLFREGLAPVIIASGGYVHPKQTIFCEAIEMKKELMLVHHIPESAILIDPQARHTRTNVRNAIRLLYSIGAPPDKVCLSISTKRHVSGMIRHFGPDFPYAAYGPRTGDGTIEFRPRIRALQIEPADPLDP